jgi:amino acid transporter
METITSTKIPIPIPGIGTTTIEFTITNGTFLAMGVAAFAVLLLYRRITVIGRMAAFLWIGVVGTTLWIIASGITHFSAAQAFSFPPGAWELSPAFFTGLGAALLIAVYDYWGYYNVCYLGGEIRDPARVIPRAILLSIGGVAAMYLTMNISILGSMPWQEVEKSSFIASDFMARIWGPRAAAVVTVLMLWTAFASVFSLLLGYSRVPYAAALDGDYFPVFARVHPKHQFPHVSLLVLGALSIASSFFALDVVIDALVATRIVVQFLGQIAGVVLLRRRAPGMVRPFRIWLYPAPVAVAALGWLFIFSTTGPRVMAFGLGVLALGVLCFLAWSLQLRQWPFRGAES